MFQPFTVIKPVIKLFSTGCWRVSSREVRDQSWGWGGFGENEWSGNSGRCSQLAQRSTRMLVSGRPSLLFLMFWANFRRKKIFFLQMRCMMSASVKIIWYWAWLIISVWQNEPILKETTVNYPKLRHHRSTEESTRENSESVKQYARIVWASLISSL